MKANLEQDLLKTDWISHNCFGNTLGFLRQQRQDFLGSCNYPYDNDPLKGYYEQ
jgi:hypothetical protein